MLCLIHRYFREGRGEEKGGEGRGRKEVGQKSNREGEREYHVLDTILKLGIQQ